MIDRTKPGIKILPKSLHYDLQYIFSYFGQDEQYKKLHEEIEEFQNATDPENYIEELSDIAVVILQFVLSDSKVQKMVYEKIKRTVTRIREGYPGYNLAEIYKMQSKNQNKIN